MCGRSADWLIGPALREANQFSAKRGDSELEEFKKFAMRGNVIDLAVGVIIGAAFGSIVSSLVADIIMLIIGAVTGGLDFSNYYTASSSKVQPGLSYVDAKKQGAVLGWGRFLTVALNFLIIAWVLFLAVKGIMKLKKEEPRRLLRLPYSQLSSVVSDGDWQE
jgi:large conductance mechanosensitive channel